MILGTGCLAELALDGEAIRETLGKVGLDRVLLSVGGAAQPVGLQGLSVAGVRASWDDREAGVQAAIAARSQRLVLDLPGDAEPDSACRGLYALARSQPGLELALLTPAEGSLASPEGLALVLDDLNGLPIGYWHVPSRCHLLGSQDAAWLETIGRFLKGASLDDVLDGEAGLPPGLGELDLSDTSELMPRDLDVALDIAPIANVGLLRLTVTTLQRLGFP